MDREDYKYDYYKPKDRTDDIEGRLDDIEAKLDSIERQVQNSTNNGCSGCFIFILFIIALFLLLNRY